MLFYPKTFTMAEDPKADAVSGKMRKGVEELGDKFKEVMGEPSTERFGTPKRICRPTGPER